jgi:hypothetical protein
MQAKGLLTGNLKSIFVYSGYRSPTDVEKEIKDFANIRKGEASIQKVSDNWWRLELTEEMKVLFEGKEHFYKAPRYFFIIPHGTIWEFHTNESGEVVNRVLDNLIKFLPKLQYKFISPDRIISLVKKYEEEDELENFSAGRDYFEIITEGNPELKIKSDDVNLRLRSSPENIWGYYKRLIEQEAIGPLLLNTVRVTIGTPEESCTLRIDKSGMIAQTSGAIKIFHQVREYFLDKFKEEMKWEEYIPKIEPNIMKDEKRGVTIYYQKEARKGRFFSINLSKPLEEKGYKNIKFLFTRNAKASGFVGSVEQEIKNSFSVRTIDARGGGEALITVKTGKSDIQIAPLPTTTLRVIDGIYRTILEKFDVKATLKCPEG